MSIANVPVSFRSWFFENEVKKTHHGGKFLFVPRPTACYPLPTPSTELLVFFLKLGLRVEYQPHAQDGGRVSTTNVVGAYFGHPVSWSNRRVSGGAVHRHRHQPSAQRHLSRVPSPPPSCEEPTVSDTGTYLLYCVVVPVIRDVQHQL